MLFQGQEFGASRAVPLLRRPRRRAGGRRAQGPRASSCAQFPRLAAPEAQARIADPAATRDVRALQAGSRASAQRTARRWRCTAICWRCAATTPAFAPAARRPPRRRGARRRRASCCASSARRDARRRLLLVNLGADLDVAAAPEPLLAPPDAVRAGRSLWSSEDRATAARASRGAGTDGEAGSPGPGTRRCCRPTAAATS